MPEIRSSVFTWSSFRWIVVIWEYPSVNSWTSIIIVCVFLHVILSLKCFSGNRLSSHKTLWLSVPDSQQVWLSLPFLLQEVYLVSSILIDWYYSVFRYVKIFTYEINVIKWVKYVIIVDKFLPIHEGGQLKWFWFIKQEFLYFRIYKKPKPLVSIWLIVIL